MSLVALGVVNFIIVQTDCLMVLHSFDNMFISKLSYSAYLVQNLFSLWAPDDTHHLNFHRVPI